MYRSASLLYASTLTCGSVHVHMRVLREPNGRVQGPGRARPRQALRLPAHVRLSSLLL